MALFLAGASLLAVILSATLNPVAVRHSYASAATPPPPPTFLPTPVGPPPGPPTNTPGPASTPAPTSTGVAAATATPIATGTVTPTTVVQQEVDFKLYAARLSKVGDPGDLVGLTMVRPNTQVWLMLYYTVNRLGRKVHRTTTYSITHAGHSLYQISYPGTEKPPEHGRLSRYTVYRLPANLPYGTYYYHATLKLGSRQERRTWTFAIGPHERQARKE